MRFELAATVLVLGVIAAAVAQKPADKKDEVSPKIFLTTFTLIVATSTSTSTFTTTSTCTTSTAALTTCTGGRRRRGLFYDDGEKVQGHRRGLFFNEEEIEDTDGSVLSIVKRSAKDEVKPIGKPADKAAPVSFGLEIQSGVSLPDGVNPNSRFAVAAGTTTTISTSTLVTTTTLTAICASTTNFPTCGTNGK